MDGNGAKWHYIMELDMEYYGWKRSQACIFFPQDFSGHHIHQVWVCRMHTEDGLGNSMDGNGAKWHHTMETDMAYYVWNPSQMALYTVKYQSLDTFSTLSTFETYKTFLPIIQNSLKHV